MFNDKNYENDFMYDWVIKSKEISKKSKIHSQLLDRTKDDKDDINYAKGRNEDNLFIHKKSFNDESGQIDIHHSSYFKNSTFIKPVKHNYEVTPLNDIYPIMEERLHDTMKHNKKNLICNKEKGDDINEYKDETKEEIKAERNLRAHRKANINILNKNYIQDTLNKSREYEDNQRGQGDSKFIVTNQRKQENKAIFARQLQSIQKTITSHFTKGVPVSRPFAGAESKYPPAKTHKYETKATANAGSEIIGDFAKHNEDFIITCFEKEDPKYSHRLDHTKNNLYTSRDEIIFNQNKTKRTNSGFRASAAAMFTNQTGGKCIFTDYE